VHEFGHFTLARINKVRVTEFRIGFGPNIVSKKIGETQWMVGLIPLGGRVCYDSREYASKTVSQRAAIVLAGPLANVAFAVVLCIAASSYGIPVPEHHNQVVDLGWISPDSEADRAGLKTGDRILGINGQEINFWRDLVKHGAEQSYVQVLRDGKYFSYALGQSALPLWGISEPIPALIGGVTKSGPAETAQIASGSTVVSYAGEDVMSWGHLLYLVNEQGQKTVEIEVIDPAGKTYQTMITPVVHQEQMRLGVDLKVATERDRRSLISSISYGFEKIGVFLAITFAGLISLFTTSISALGGPIAAARVTSSAMELGPAIQLQLAGFASLQIGLLNLLPLTVLDGGQLLLLGYEKLRSKKPSETFMKNYHRFGAFAFTLLLMIVFYSDLVKLLS